MSRPGRLGQLSALHAAVTAEAVTTVLHVDPDLAFLRGHYPEYPVVPAVFLIDAVLDAAAATRAGRHWASGPALWCVDAMRLHHPVLPADTITVAARCRGEREGRSRVEATVTLADGAVAAAFDVTLGGAPPADDHVAAAAGSRPVQQAPSVVGARDPLTLSEVLPHRDEALLLDHTPLLSRENLAGTWRYCPGVVTALPGQICALPDALVLESMLQAAAATWLVTTPQTPGDLVLVAAAAGVSFQRRPLPGDLAGGGLVHSAWVTRSMAGAAKVSAHTVCGSSGRLLASVREVTVLRGTAARMSRPARIQPGTLAQATTR